MKDKTFDNSQYDFKSDISTELSGSFADLIDYEKLGTAVYQAQSKALQENPVTIGDKEVFESTRRGQNIFYKKTGTVGLAGV